MAAHRPLWQTVSKGDSRTSICSLFFRGAMLKLGPCHGASGTLCFAPLCLAPLCFAPGTGPKDKMASYLGPALVAD